MKQHWVCALALCVVGVGVSFGQDTTTVNWGNFSNTPATQSAILFRDAAGTPLSQATANTNSDGMLVQLGYYTGATAANSFTGTWVPITGAATVSRTSIGDAFNNNGGGGNGSGAGVIDFQTFFGPGTGDPTHPFVYDPNFSGSYQTLSSISISNSAPPNGQIMSIRFYDTTTGSSGSYNAVSADGWTWQSPNTAGGGIVNISVATVFAAGGLEWESFDNFSIAHAIGDFKTVIAIPEPSSFALLGLALAAIPLLRRRKA